MKPVLKAGFPPNIEQIRAVLTVSDRTVYTYGSTIYTGKNSVDIIAADYPLCCHEAVHTKQQGDDPETWWARYLTEPRWRLEQEIEAYRVQYKKARKKIRDGHIRKRYLHEIAGFLSSSLYGSVVSFDEAVSLIKHDSLF